MSLSFEKRHLPDFLAYHKRGLGGADFEAVDSFLLLEDDPGDGSSLLLLESDVGAGDDALELEDSI
jgi:hypothetical protein